MDFLNVLKRNQDVLIGTGAGVILAPSIVQKLSDMFQLGSYESLIIELGIAAGALAVLGKSKPEMATAFASVFIAYAALDLVPQLQA